MAFKAAWREAARAPVGTRARLASKKTADEAWYMLQTGSGYASEVRRPYGLP